LFDEDRFRGRPRTWIATTLISVTLGATTEQIRCHTLEFAAISQHLVLGYGTVAQVWPDHRIQPWRREIRILHRSVTGRRGHRIVGLYLRFRDLAAQDRDTALAKVIQPDVELWVAHGRTIRQRLRDFLR
jgi:hypothetical protein